MKKILIDKLLKNNVFFKDKILNISEYEVKNIEIIEEVFKNNEKINMLVTPDKEPIHILLLIVLAINLYIKNLSCRERGILSYLNTGDMVTYNGKKAEYLGITNIYGKEKIKLRHKGNIIKGIRMEDGFSYIPLSEYYKLSIYRGDSKGLSTMPNVRSNKKSGKYILLDMLNLELESLGSIVDEQMVIVYPNKKDLEDLLNNIEIKIKDKKYYFTEIFPCKYYSSVGNSIDFKGNKLKLKELLIFTTRLDNAIDIIQKNENTSQVLLLGEENYIHDIDSDLDFLLTRRKVKKAYIFNTFSNISNISTLLNKEYHIRLYAWLKNAFLENLKLNYRGNYVTDNELILNYIYRNVRSKVIYDESDITQIIIDLKDKLFSIAEDDFNYKSKEEFLKITYGILKVIEKIIIPIEKYDDYIKMNCIKKHTITELLEYLELIVEESKMYSSTYKILNSIVIKTKELIEILYYNNPKLEVLQKQNLVKRTLILCCSPIEVEVLKKHSFFKSKYINIQCISKYKSDRTYENVIFTGVYKSKNIDQLAFYSGLNIVNLLYPSEVIKYNKKVIDFNNRIRCMENNNVLSVNKHTNLLEVIKLHIKDNYQNKTIDTLETKEAKMEEKIYGKPTDKNYEMRLDLNYDIDDLLNISSYNNFNGTNIAKYDESGEVKKYIKFNCNKYAFLTKYYKATFWDYTNNKISYKNINSIELNNKLIFIETKTDSELIDLFHKIICSDIFKSKYYEHYKNMRYWKEALKKYINTYYLEFSNIATELMIHGVNRGEGAIRSWILDDKIIGPTEKEVYKALSEITKDAYFRKNWEAIYKSCKLLRSFRGRFRNRFNNMVIKSILKENSNADELEILVYEVLGDLKEYAQILEVKYIEDISLNVPIYRLNCVLDKPKAEELIQNYLI